MPPRSVTLRIGWNSNSTTEIEVSSLQKDITAVTSWSTSKSTSSSFSLENPQRKVNKIVTRFDNLTGLKLQEYAAKTSSNGILSSSLFELSIDRQSLRLRDGQLLGGGSCTSSQSASSSASSTSNGSTRRSPYLSGNNGKRGHSPTELSRCSQTRNAHTAAHASFPNEECETDDTNPVKIQDIPSHLSEFYSSIDRILKLEIIDASVECLLKRLIMRTIECSLLGFYAEMINSLSNGDSNSGSAPIILAVAKLKKYVSKCLMFLKKQRDAHAVESQIVLLGVLNRVLECNQLDKKRIAKLCTPNDFSLFSLNLDQNLESNNAGIASQNVKSSDVRQVENLRSKSSNEDQAVSQSYDGLDDSVSVLLKQTNPIFHLIAYRRVVRQNYNLCGGHLKNIVDRLLFAHHKSFNRLQEQLRFEARYYAFFSLDALVGKVYSMVLKESSNIQSKKKEEIVIGNSVLSESIYLSSFLFGVNEGMLSRCEDEFKLKLSMSDNQCASTFLECRVSFRFIATKILRSCYALCMQVSEDNRRIAVAVSTGGEVATNERNAMFQKAVNEIAVMLKKRRLAEGVMRVLILLEGIEFNVPN